MCSSDLRRRQATVAGVILTLAGAVPLAWLFWQAQVLNHALTHDTGALAAPGSWIAWLAILVLTAGTAYRIWGIWQAADRSATSGHLKGKR